MSELVLQKLLSLVAVIAGACLLGAEYGARTGLAVGLLAWALLPSDHVKKEGTE